MASWMIVNMPHGTVFAAVAAVAVVCRLGQQFIGADSANGLAILELF